MSKIAHSVEELIGHTPLLALERYGARHGFSAQGLAKLEYLNSRQLHPRSVRQPRQPGRPLPHHRPGDLGGHAG